jgi:hypothetical protein
MKKLVSMAVGALVVAGVAVAATPVFHAVTPSRFDPGNTKLVQSVWLTGIGCPTNAKLSGATTPSPYTAAGCPTGDAADKENKGLLLAKTGPTDNNASAVAQLKDPPPTVTELGYDLRKPGIDQTDPRGSHCGAGAPRFNVITTTGTIFVGCNSPPPTVEAAGDGWQRLRWNETYTNVTAIYIVFDEGQDTGPDNFGAAVLDNVDVNGKLVGRG